MGLSRYSQFAKSPPTPKRTVNEKGGPGLIPTGPPFEFPSFPERPAACDMDDAANDGLAKLQSEALKLLVSLEGEIEELRQLAPPGYDEAIGELTETMRTIHDAIQQVSSADRR